MLLDKIGKGLKKGFLISFSSLFLFFSCQNLPNPLGTKIDYILEKSEGYKFTGDTIEASITPLEKQYTRIEVKHQRPNQDFSAYEELKSQNNKYPKTINTKTYGDYFFKFRIKSGETFTETEVVKISGYMNEAQLREKFDEILAPMLKPGSTNDFDVIGYDINLNQIRNGVLYNDDANIVIYDSNVGGNRRRYVIEGQGDINDIYSQKKYDDAKAVNVSYDHRIPKEVLNLKKIILDLKAKGWPLTY